MIKTVKCAAAVAAIALLAVARPAAAADPPRWVAAIYVEAQKMVGLRWMPAAGATGYKVLRSETAGSGYQEIASVTTPQHLDKELEAGSTYYYVLQSVDAAGTSANSEERSVSIPGVKKREVVQAPTWKAVTTQQVTEFGKTSFRVGLSWERSPSRDVVAYNIYRSTTPGKDYALIGSVAEDRFIDSTGEKDKTYYYVLTATDTSFQETAFSEEKSVSLKVAEVVAPVKKKDDKNKLAAYKTRFINRIPAKTEDGEGFSFQRALDFAWHPDEERVYATDSNIPTIVAFDMDGELVLQFGTRGMSEGNISRPWGIDVDNEGQILVTDLTRRKVIIFKPNGTFVREFSVDTKLKPEDPELPMPVFVAQAANGDYLVTDNANGHILRFSEDGKLIGGFGEPVQKGKTGLGYFAAPGGIAVDKQGRILVQDYGSTRVQVLDPDGKPLFSIGEGVKGLVGSFVKVGEPFVDEELKVIIVPDNAMGNVQAFSLEDGSYRYTMTNEKGDLAFEERAAWDISSTQRVLKDSKGRYWILEGLPNKLVIIQPVE